MRKKITAILLTLLLTVSLLAGCGSSGSGGSGSGIRVFLAVGSIDTFRQIFVDAATASAASAGITLDMANAEGASETQIEQIKNAAASGYDAIICIPVDSATAQEIEAAADGIPIIFSSNLPDAENLEANKYIFVSSYEQEAGRYQAEYVMNLFSGQTELNVVMLKGEPGHSGATGREKGFKYAMQDAGITVNYVFEDHADWTVELAASEITQFLKTNQPYDCIVSHNDNMALGAIEALKNAGIDPSSVPILGVDATDVGVAAIASGEMDFTVYQPAEGQADACIEAAIALSQGNTIENIEGVTDDQTYVWVPYEPVDSSNYQDYE